MADVITRFKLETTQFDSKLRDAAKELSSITKEAQSCGSSFTNFSSKSVEAARALGQTASGASNAKDKVRDLVGAYNEAAKAYNDLTVQQQQSDYGKAMAASLEELKQRIGEAKEEMQGMGKQVSETGGIMEQLASKFTLNIDAVKLFNLGLQAAKAVLDVAKDAFFNNEEQLDDWGRTVEASDSLYKGFLNSLNTGDISGYLSSIDSIMKAARDAYNALDELATFNAFNQINVQKTRTQMQESIVDYREGTGDKESVRVAGDAYKKELLQRKKLEEEAYKKKIAEVAAQRGVNASDLEKALSGSYGNYQNLKQVKTTGVRRKWQGSGNFGGGYYVTENYAKNDAERMGVALRALNDTELDTLQKLGAQAQRTGEEVAQVDKQLVRVLNSKGTTGTTTTTRTTSTGGGGGGHTDKELTITEQIAALEKEAYTATDERREAIGKQIRELDAVLAKQKEIRKALHDTSGDDVDFEKLFPTQTPSASSDVTPLGALQDKIRIELSEQNIAIDEASLENLLRVAIENGIEGLDPDFSALQEMMGEGMDIPDEAWEELQNKINEKLAALNLDPVQIDFKTGDVKSKAKDMAKDWKSAASAIQEVGSAMSQIEDPMAKVVGTVAQAIASVALGYAQATAQAASMGPWAWVAFAATGLATMLSTISAIHSATGYAEGGIVKGSTWSGDQIPGANIGVNAGELILNRAQQGAIASQLTSANGTARLEAVVTGEQLRLVLNNNSRRMGYGEYVTFK